MRIVYDGRWLGRTGIGRYAEELLEQLQAQDHTNRYYVLLLPAQYAKWRPTNSNFRAVRTTHEVYTWQEQVLLPFQIRALKPDLVHFTSFNLPILYFGHFITTVHDLTLVHFRNARGRGLGRGVYEVKYWAMRLVLKMAVGRARAVLVPTEFVRGEVAKFFPNAQGKTIVTYEGGAEAFAKPAGIDKFGLPKQFLLYVGNYYPYKNVGRLVQAFAKTQARKGGAKLVLAGKPDYFQEQERAAAGNLGLGDSVVWPGFVSDAELAGLYAGAALYVFPSLSEGFGLPGLEAMAQGTPVLAAQASCLPEVYGEAAEYFDPLDVDGLARHIDQLLGDGARLAALRKAGAERVKQFSWARMTEQTLAAYQVAKGN